MQQVGRLSMEGLVGRTCRVAFFDPRRGPFLAVAWTGWFGVLLALFGPGHREARVEIAAGVERCRCRVDHRQRRDRGEVGWVTLRSERLADPTVGGGEHANHAGD